MTVRADGDQIFHGINRVCLMYLRQGRDMVHVNKSASKFTIDLLKVEAAYLAA